ncbi:hypothetical protein F2Q68_00012971 [Brassica cretica]|uniref:GAT domain-containing protein n=1 Tax=Brassica cretica TaxID=69181 RepID=A0A8S9HHF9_BRACR|nr:hypothetical protein F2Q68_00012971 [Brassica cretica]
MALLVKNGEADSENRRRAFQLVRAWGLSQDLAYLPVFQETYMSLEGENGLNASNEDNPMAGQGSLGSLMQRPVPVPPPGSYPVPNQEQPRGDDDGLLDDYNFGSLTIKDKKEQIEITRNSLELLSSMLSTEGKPNHTEDELTVSLVEKCKQSQPLIQMIIESTTDDEGVLFEALHVNDELQRVLSIYEKPDESEEKASIVGQESTGSKYAGPKPTEEEERLEGENGLNARNEDNPMAGQGSLGSLMQRPVPVPPPGSYPVPNQEQPRGDDDGLLDDYNFGSLTIKDKKEQIEITRNSLELLSSMLSTEGKPNHTEDELTALHVNDELQRVLSIYEKAGETEEKASMVDQESSGSKDAHPKPTEEEEKRFVKQKDHVENSESSDKTVKEDKKVKIELGLSSDEDEN